VSVRAACKNQANIAAALKKQPHRQISMRHHGIITSSSWHEVMNALYSTSLRPANDADHGDGE